MLLAAGNAVSGPEGGFTEVLGFVGGVAVGGEPGLVRDRRAAPCALVAGSATGAGRRVGGMGVGVGEEPDPPGERGGEFPGAQRGLSGLEVGPAVQEQVVRGGQDVGGLPAVLSGGGDGGDQRGPGGVGDDPGTDVMAEGADQGFGPAGAQLTVAASAGGV